jgi:glutathione S-transferase
MTIKLLTFPPAFGMSTVTPFGTKVETYLRIAGLPYERVSKIGPTATPKGKLPIIVDDDGATVADSQFIVEHLEKKHGHPLDGKLDDAQRALGHFVRRTFDEGFYWIAVWSRWSDETGWAHMRPEAFASVPAPARAIAAPIVRRMMRKQLHAQGTGRHAAQEVTAMGKADLTAFSRVLGDRPFTLGGESPTTVDCTAWAFLAHLTLTGFEGPLQDHARGLKNLPAYVERIRGKWWG